MSLLFRLFSSLILSALVACAGPAVTGRVPATHAPAIATIAIPGDARVVSIARDVLPVQVEHSPDLASRSGLIDDAIQVPPFMPEHRAAMLGEPVPDF